MKSYIKIGTLIPYIILVLLISFFLFGIGINIRSSTDNSIVFFHFSFLNTSSYNIYDKLDWTYQGNFMNFEKYYFTMPGIDRPDLANNIDIFILTVVTITFSFVCLLLSVINILPKIKPGIHLALDGISRILNIGIIICGIILLIFLNSHYSTVVQFKTGIETNSFIIVILIIFPIILQIITLILILMHYRNIFKRKIKSDKEKN